MERVLKLLAICLCSTLVACSQAVSEPDPLKLPKNDADYQALQNFAHQTIPDGQWNPLCPAPREEIDAKITLLGYAKNWDQDTLDGIRAQERERLYNTQKKYAPKPVMLAAELENDLARGQAIRKLEEYDQFWASAIFRHSELREGVPEENRPILGFMFNRGQCEEQMYVLETLKPILETSDFPTEDRFGEGTMHRLFMIVQHADEDIEFQVKMLHEFQSRPGSIPKHSLAMLTDRVKINQGELQIYGSQLQCKDGKYQPRPVADPKNLDQRRASVGLEPFEDYAAGTPGCGNRATFQ